MWQRESESVRGCCSHRDASRSSWPWQLLNDPPGEGHFPPPSSSLCARCASRVLPLGRAYLFSLKGNQPTLEAEAQRLLGDQQHALASSQDWQGTGLRVVRRLYLTEQIAGFAWDRLRTVLRVESQTYAHGRLTAWEDRYFVSSLPSERLTPAKWQRRMHCAGFACARGPHCTSQTRTVRFA